MPRSPSLTDYLDAGLRAADLRQSAIANNLANARRVGYRRMDVKFEDLLDKAMDSLGGAKLDRAEPELFRPMETPVGPNGNDVALDRELGELMSNSGRYKTMMRILRKTYEQMQMAMKTEG